MLQKISDAEQRSSRACANYDLEKCLFNIKQVSIIVELSRSCIYGLIRAEKFPRPIKITKYASRWKKDEILEWIDSQPRMDTSKEMIDAAKQNTSIWQEAIYKEATQLAWLGYSIVPLRRLTKKLPPKKYNIGYHSASKNEGTLRKWFAPGTGKFRGSNLGIAAGRDGGVFVVDIDKKGGLDGEESLKTLESKFGDIGKCPVQKTANGGMHFLFCWEPGAVSTVGKIAAGIDTRGGTATEFKSHIVVYPSVVVNDDGVAGRYEWRHSPYRIEELPLAPNWAVRGNTQTELDVQGRGSEMVEISDLEPMIPVKQIEGMLAATNPDDLTYDDWLRVGQAINSQHCGNEGLDLWDLWSQQGTRYKPGECSSRWNSFDPSGKIRIGTLFYMAKSAGWVPSEADQYHSVPEEILHEINDLYPLATIANKVRMVNLDDDGSVIIYHPNDVRLLYQNRFIELQVGDRTVYKNPVDLWLSWEHRLTYDRMGFYPSPLDCPENHLNLWRGFAVEPEKGDVEIFTDFVREVMCRGNDEHCDWLLDWIAQMLQFPGTKPGTAVVLRGAEGTGKNTLTKALSKLLYPSNFTHMVNPKHFTSNFNSFILQSILCVLNEAIWSGNHQEANILKGLITEDNLSVELKGFDTFSAINCARLIILTNNVWAVPAGHQSRRYFVLEVSNDRKGDTAYWKKLHKWIDDHGPQLLWYFQNRNIKSNLRQALETSELLKQRELTALRDTTPADEVAYHLVTKGKAQLAPEGSKLEGKYIWTNDLLRKACKYLVNGISVSQQFPRAIGRLFEEQGFPLEVDRTKECGRLFVLPDTPEPLLKCISEKFNIPIDELDFATEWSHEEDRDVALW